MSRIGYKTIVIPEGVTVTRDEDVITVKGPKGELSETFSPDVAMNVNGNEINFEPTGKYDNKMRALHGTQRANLANMIEGVEKGFNKTLKLVGVGYRTQLKGSDLILNVGYSNPVDVKVPEDIDVKVPDNTTIEIAGINKQHVGDFAAKVREIRSPEPYKGKGIRYENEHITLREGKTGK
ncbi:50S ribosomal protein L6 [Fructilactobacillus sanfranciscensis]|uniref:Large ribosomal subunit protein uL6 n=2 Tax=Fructilactobacillus sanfranciscensis TaxID=1625 RepID=G2KVX7_FRUST|nr:50S ribosomal protein L6 [Fructilactobacillus sanfranciscensis]AEN99506.1 50S ribosomal protein L6 [Fructilactobacillus sanfranciscensis TMW 1.1304]MCG7194660.1 50S ribosomal protein L6 [Fructilactobacillus sanfranciscensis]MCG7195751.1 50S ribosomal protein L6 [Fructilactobacillus sanfranciscensis]MDN4461943.1 50S ribosomal protein L6 [Fructilactobacillus sanfranciscensis]MVF15686.1 50S ribosomal protein L6 [Fructilactobacillus sanfranciscensis]